MMVRLKLSSAMSALACVLFSSHATLNNQTYPLEFKPILFKQTCFCFALRVRGRGLLLFTTVDIFLEALCAFVLHLHITLHCKKQ